MTKKHFKKILSFSLPFLSFPRKRESRLDSPIKSGNDNALESGFSTVEMLIAFLVVILSITAVIGVVFGSQSMGLDTETNQEAQLLAQNDLEDARAQSREDFDSVNTTPTSTVGIYSSKLTLDLGRSTNCKKEIVSRVTWKTEQSRPQFVELRTDITDPQLAFELGSDCFTQPPDGTGNDLTELWSINIGGAKNTGLDVLEKKVYMIWDASPGLSIVDAKIPTSSILVNFTNGFSLPNGVNSIDVAKNNTNGKTYAYLANDNETAPFNQFLIINVTTSTEPVLVASENLPGVIGTCPFTCPQGRSIFYFDDKVYIGTHRLAPLGPPKHEFHIYDVSNPNSPVWLGSKKIDHNVNDIVVSKQDVGGIEKIVAFIATSADPDELMALDVTNPATVTLITSIGLPGDADANRLNLDKSKNLIYVGKLSSSEDELFALDISDLQSGIIIKGSANTSSKISDLQSVGRFVYLATNETTGEFQIWNSDLNNFTIIGKLNISNFESTGLDYEDNLLYVAFKQGSNSLVIFKVP